MFISIRCAGHNPREKALAGAALIAPTAPHPAPSGPPSPRGRRIPDRSAAFYKVQPYTPSEPRKRGPPPPTQGRHRPTGLAYEIRAGGACRRPYKASPEVLCHFSLFSLHFSLFSKKSLPALFQVQGAIFYFSFCRRTSMTRAAWFRCRMAAYSARWASSGV